MDLDVSTLAAFAQDYQRLRAENATLRSELEEARAFASRDTSVLGTPLVVPGKNFLQLPSGEYRYPTPAETVERAVWRRVEFLHYLKRNGIDASNVRTSLVIDWFKRWFLHETDGWQRRKNAGYTLDEVQTLSVHHIIPQEVGGRHSVYNYHILPRAVNSHLGWQLGRAASLWVGEENLRVALQYAQFVRDRTHTNDTNFNPEALPCPRRVSTKRPAEAPPIVVLPNKQPRMQSHRIQEVSDDLSHFAPPADVWAQVTLVSGPRIAHDRFGRNVVRFNTEHDIIDVQDVFRTLVSEEQIRQHMWRHVPTAQFPIRKIKWNGKGDRRRVLPIRTVISVLSQMRNKDARHTAEVLQSILTDINDMKVQGTSGAYA